MRYTITFNLPDEEYDFKCALNATKYRAVIEELDLKLRNTTKYGASFLAADKEACDVESQVCNAIRELIFDLLNEHGININ